jgi:ankyrin repeat protein
MAPPYLPLDVLLMIAYEMTDDDGERCFSDLNSFLQVNRTLHHYLNPLLWREAASSSKTTQRVLIHLLKTRNVERLKYFLELGADVETLFPDFHTDCEVQSPSALIAAAYVDSVPMARLLLENGAIVEYPPESPYLSAMHMAWSVEMAQLLLEFGADVQKVDNSRTTPLHAAAELGATQVARLLVDLWPKGVRALNLALETPLLCAALAGRTAVVKFLLECWPEGVMVKDRSLCMPLHWAAFSGSIETVRLLAECWPPGIREKARCGKTPLHFAASAGRTEIVKFFLERWPEGMTALDIFDQTPLHSAAQLGETDVVRLLVDLCPESAGYKDNFGNTPLHLAARWAHTDVMRLLVECWPEGKKEKNRIGKIPLERLMRTERWLSLNDAQKDEFLSLLGGRRPKLHIQYS